MKLRNRLLILIMTIAIASTMWVPAFAVSKDDLQPPEIKAEAAVVIDAKTGEVLYEKDAYSRREPASITKIVTCLVALDHLEDDRQITIRHDGNPTGNNIALKAGEVFTADQLLHALMMYSANDVAVAIAEEVGGTEENFCAMMNEKAAECGATASNFMNPNGLNWPGDEGHLTTAYDMAVITREALKNEKFRELISTVTYEIPATNMSDARKIFNTNKFMWNDEIIKYMENKLANEPNPESLWVPEPYEGVIGVKTGTTSTAGSCFVGAVNSHGTELISVVLKSGEDDRFRDTTALWDYAIAKFYDTHVMAAAGESADKIRVKRGEVRTVDAVPDKDAVVTVPEGETLKGVKTKIEADELRAPVEKGQNIGKVKVYLNDEVVCERDLFAAETVEEGGFLSIFGIPDWMAPFVYATVVLIILIASIIGIIVKTGKGKRKENRRSA